MIVPELYRDLTTLELAFPGALRDRLVAAIRSGAKSATTSLVVECERMGRTLPYVGERQVVLDSGGEPAAEVETTAVQRCRLAEVPLEHVIADGGNADLTAWRVGHERYWHSDEYRAWIDDSDFRVDDDTELLCIKFQLIARL